jgi:hypothetical protein
MSCNIRDYRCPDHREPPLDTLDESGTRLTYNTFSPGTWVRYNGVSGTRGIIIGSWHEGRGARREHVVKVMWSDPPVQFHSIKIPIPDLSNVPFTYWDSELGVWTETKR